MRIFQSEIPAFILNVFAAQVQCVQIVSNLKNRSKWILLHASWSKQYVMTSYLSASGSLKLAGSQCFWCLTNNRTMYLFWISSKQWLTSICDVNDFQICKFWLFVISIQFAPIVSALSQERSTICHINSNLLLFHTWCIIYNLRMSRFIVQHFHKNVITLQLYNQNIYYNKNGTLNICIHKETITKVVSIVNLRQMWIKIKPVTNSNARMLRPKKFCIYTYCWWIWRHFIFSVEKNCLRGEVKCSIIKG